MAFAIYSDASGLPYSDYGNYRGIDIGVQRSILCVAERGLCCSNEFSLGFGKVLLSYDWSRWPVNKDYEPKSTQAALALMEQCAEWLLEEVSDESNFAVWKYPYPITYETKAGWRSAQAQAVGMQLLVRYAKISGDDKYLAPLAGLLRAFEVSVPQGGLLDISEDGIVWYEKLADQNNLKPKILNGMMFTVLGLYDIATIAHSDKARKLAEAGAKSVLELLPRFDLGNWSAYDIMGRKASPHYHQIHIQQLKGLYDITGEQTFLGWSQRFARYTGPDGEKPKNSATWNAINPVGDSYRANIVATYLAERVHHPTWRREHEAVRDFLNVVADGASVLDVPFGTGRFCSLYKQRNMVVTGVDISLDMLDFARQALGDRHDEIELVRANAESLPFPNRHFDIVVCVRFLETIIPFGLVPGVLCELRRVTRQFAIVRLNNREEHLSDMPPPTPVERMGVNLKLDQLDALCRTTGWKIRSSVVVGLKHPNKPHGEKRICLLEVTTPPGLN